MLDALNDSTSVTRRSTSGNDMDKSQQIIIGYTFCDVIVSNPIWFLGLTEILALARPRKPPALQAICWQTACVAFTQNTLRLSVRLLQTLGSVRALSGQT